MQIPLKTHGGKHYLASRIVAMMPEHTHYVEAYAGGLAVLLTKLPNKSEVVNDVHRELITFWRVLQDTNQFEALKRRLDATPFSRIEYADATAKLESQGGSLSAIDIAHAFFVCCRQSLAGRQQTFAPLSKSRTRRGINEQASAWWTAIDGLEAVYRRLQGVVIECDDALNIIRREDSHHTLFYLDPPYLASTRSAPNVYKHEMTVRDHKKLLRCLLMCKGKVMLSGYPSKLYDDALRGWVRHEFDLVNHASGDDEKRKMTECVWCNFRM